MGVWEGRGIFMLIELEGQQAAGCEGAAGRTGSQGWRPLIKGYSAMQEDKCLGSGQQSPVTWKAYKSHQLP